MPPIPSPRISSVKPGAPAQTLTWIKSSVYLCIKREDGRDMVECPADVFGVMAVHQDYNERNKWAATVVATGDCAVPTFIKGDALKIAEVLARSCRQVLSLPDRKQQHQQLPKWVKPWIEKCRDDQGFVSPIPFQLKYRS